MRSPWVTVYGVIALSSMLAMYALEGRGKRYVYGFALGCVASSVYGFLAGAWPFGVVELVWSLVALRRAGVVGRSRGTAAVDGTSEVNET